ncbi:MAG: hypothetical protein IT462_13855 [Planctomycetes bacterium]|nr:hypothetical protein [Planctomycetota bacterium]
MTPFLRNLVFAVLVLPCAATPLLADAALDKNLGDARAAIKAKDYDTARIAARAVLSSDPLHQEGRLLLSDAHEGLNQSNEAVIQAMLAIDSPSRGNKSSASLVTRATKRVQDKSPNLLAFVNQRKDSTGLLLKLRTKALSDKRAQDAEWLATRLGLLSPWHPEVEKLTAGVSPRSQGGEKKTPVKGTGVDLLEYPDKWTLKNLGGKSEISALEMVLLKPADGFIGEARLLEDDYKTPDSFTLSFELKWDGGDVDGSGDSSFWLIFCAQKVTDFSDAAVTIDLTHSKKRVCGYADHPKVDDPLWKIQEWRNLGDDKVKAGQWHALSVSFSGADRKLKVMNDKVELLTFTTSENKLSQRYISFGIGNCAEAAIRNVFLKKEK